MKSRREFIIMFPAATFAFSQPGILIAQDVDRRTVIAPQLAVGWEGTPRQPGSFEWVTDFQLTGTNFLAKEGETLVKFLKNDGSPMVVDLAWSGGSRVTNVSSQPVTLKPHISVGGTISACTSCGSQSLQAGVIIFLVPFSWDPGSYNYNDDVSVQVVYRRLDWQGNELTAAGVDVKPLMKKFSVPVVMTSRADSGLAIYNPNDKSVSLTASLFNSQSTGDPALPVASAVITLKSGEQQSFLFSQVFKNLKPDKKGNLVTDGHVEFSGDLAVAVTALKCFFPPSGNFVIGGIPITQLK